ncbi:DmX-like protein 1, partial [Cichlidogyrus casuarinus]
MELLLLLSELSLPIREIFGSSLEEAKPQTPVMRQCPMIGSVLLNLLDSVPLFRSLLIFPVGEIVMQRPSKLLKGMLEDLLGTLDSLSPPYLTSIQCTLARRTGTEEAFESVSESAPCAREGVRQHRLRKVFLLRNLCIAISGCLHQSLCTGGWLSLGTSQSDSSSSASEFGLSFEAIPIPATAMTVKTFSGVEKVKANTEPSKWPGLTCLNTSRPSKRPTQALSCGAKTDLSVGDNLQGFSGDPVKALSALMAQCLVSVYLGLFNYALNLLRGGSPAGPAIRPLKPTVPPRGPSPCPTREQSPRPTRARPPPPTPSTSASDEWFIPPRHSLISALLRKPVSNESTFSLSTVYDSDTETVPAGYETIAQSARSELKKRNRRRKVQLRSFLEIHREEQARLKEEMKKRVASVRRKEHLREKKEMGDADSDDDANNANKPKKFEELYPDLVAREERKLKREKVQQPSISMESEVEEHDTLQQHEAFSLEWLVQSLCLDPDFGFSPFDKEEPAETASYKEIQDLMLAKEKSVNREAMVSQLIARLERELVAKPTTGASSDALDLSDVESVDEDDDDTLEEILGRSGSKVSGRGRGGVTQDQADDQWSNGDSFSWRLIRCACVQIAYYEVQSLINLLDFDADSLALYAPGLIKCSRLVKSWADSYRLALIAPPSPSPSLNDVMGPRSPGQILLPPCNFLPNMDTAIQMPVIPAPTKNQSSKAAPAPAITPSVPSKFQQRMTFLSSQDNTPFQTNNPHSLPVKRLWCGLTLNPLLAQFFVREVFRVPRTINYNTVIGPLALMPTETNVPHTEDTAGEVSAPEPTDGLRQSLALLVEDDIRIVHRDHEPLIAMCCNQTNMTSIAVATSKEIIELDISHLVYPPVWMVNDIEMEIDTYQES